MQSSRGGRDKLTRDHRKEELLAEKTGSKNQAEISKMLGKIPNQIGLLLVGEYAYDIFRSILHTNKLILASTCLC